MKRRRGWDGKVNTAAPKAARQCQVRVEDASSYVQPDIMPFFRRCGELHFPLRGRDNNSIWAETGRDRIGI